MFYLSAMLQPPLNDPTATITYRQIKLLNITVFSSMWFMGLHFGLRSSILCRLYRLFSSPNIRSSPSQTIRYKVEIAPNYQKQKKILFFFWLETRIGECINYEINCIALRWCTVKKNQQRGWCIKKLNIRNTSNFVKDHMHIVHLKKTMVEILKSWPIFAKYNQLLIIKTKSSLSKQHHHEVDLIPTKTQYTTQSKPISFNPCQSKNQVQKSGQ